MPRRGECGADDAVAEPGTAGRTVRYLTRLFSGTLKLPVDRDRRAGAAGAIRHRFDLAHAADAASWRRASARCRRRCSSSTRPSRSWRGYFLQSITRSGWRAARSRSPARRCAEPCASASHAARCRWRGVRSRGHQPRMPAPPAQARTDIAIIGVSGRYPQAQRPGGVLGEPEGGQGLHHRDSAGALGPRAVLRSAEGQARQDLQQVGRLHRRRRSVRSAVLQHLARARRSSWIRRSGCSCSACTRRWRMRATRARALRTGASGEPAGSVGVFVGVMYEEYQLYGAQAQAARSRLCARRQSPPRSPTACPTSATSTARAWRWTRCARRR